MEERVRHAGGEWGFAEAAACREGAQCEGRDHPADDGGQDHAGGGRRCRWRTLAAGRIEAVQRSRERDLGRLDDLCRATRHGRQRCVRQHAAHDRRGKHHDQDETPPEGHVLTIKVDVKNERENQRRLARERPERVRSPR